MKDLNNIFVFVKVAEAKNSRMRPAFLESPVRV